MGKSNRSWRESIFFITGGLLLAGGFLFYSFRINHESIWLDEAFTWGMTNHSYWEIIKYTISNDVHPPLYYLMVKLFRFFGGDSIGAIRLFSIFGALCLAAFGLGPVRRAGGAKAGLLFSGLTLLTPVILSMADEARMYTWSVFFVTGTVLYAYLAGAEGKPGDWVKLGLLTLGAAYIHYYALLAVIIANLLLLVWLLTKNRGRLRPYLITMGVVLLGYLPWVPAIFHHLASEQGAWIQPVSAPMILKTLYYPFGGEFSSYAPGLFIFRPYAFWLSCVIIGWGLWQKAPVTVEGKNVAPVNFLAVATYGLTIGMAILFSWFFRPILTERYIIPLLGLFILGLSVGWSRIQKPSLFWGTGLLFLILVIPSLYQIYQFHFSSPTREIAAYLKPKLKGEAALVHFSWDTPGASGYYFPRVRNFVYLPEMKGNQADNVLPRTTYGSEIDFFLKGSQNVWFLISSALPDGEARARALITSRKLTIIGRSKVFGGPYSFSKILVIQLKAEAP